MSPTRFDVIAKEAGLISKLPGRSEVMHTKINFEYEGNLQGLIEFLEATFKEPNALTLKVTAASQAQSLTGRQKLVKGLLASWNMPAHPDLEAKLVTGLTPLIGHMKVGEKIQAIKLLREIAGVGLKEAKDAVEGPIAQYLNTVIMTGGEG